MAGRDQYAKWCKMLLDGENHMIDEVMIALEEDGYIDDHEDWIDEEDDE